jgi:Cu-Zn family superoxide dismutase
MRTTGIWRSPASGGRHSWSGFAFPGPPTPRRIESERVKVTGKATFTEVSPGVTRVEVWIENATPGSHGLHLHEKGDCSAPDATSAGGHFNSAGNPHAGPTDPKHHNGDFGNIEIGASGTGHLDMTSNLLSVKRAPTRSSARPSSSTRRPTTKTQPTGNAGDVMAAGDPVERGHPEGQAGHQRQAHGGARAKLGGNRRGSELVRHKRSQILAPLGMTFLDPPAFDLSPEELHGSAS